MTLEDDVAASLKRLGKRRGIKFKLLVNEVLRDGIRCLMEPRKKRSNYCTRSVDLGSCRATNVDNIAGVLAILEHESFK
jgi:hypothetical protein